MSIQTAKKVVWKKFKVAAPPNTDRQTCYPLPGECTLTYVFKAMVDKRTQPCGSVLILYT